MNTRRITLSLGTGAGALLGAALLSGLTSPLASADAFGFEPIPAADFTELGVNVSTTNPAIIATLPAFGGHGTDTISYEFLANEDTTTSTFETPDLTGTTTPNPEFGEATELVNTYNNPLFTDTSTQVLGVSPDAPADAPVDGATTDTILLDPSLLGNNFGVFYESIPGATATAAPTVTTDLITPFGEVPLSGGLGGGLDSLLGSFGDLLGGSTADSLGSTGVDSLFTPLLDVLSSIL